MTFTVIFSAIIGVLQVLFESLALGFLLSKKYLHGAAVILLKAALYGAGIFILLKFFRDFAVGAAVGFAVGFFVALAAVIIFRNVKAGKEV